MKNHKPKKAYKKSRKGSRRKKGLSGVSTAGKALSLKNSIAETGKQAGGTLTGLLISAGLGTVMDKIPFMKAKETDGKMIAIVKKAIKPVVLIGAGTTIAVMSRKKGSKFVSSIGDGIIVGGGFSAVKSLVGTKMPFFNGLGSTDIDVLSKVDAYYQENLDAVKQALIENGKVVDLKGIEEEGMNGTPTIPGTQLNNMTSGNIL